MPPYLTPTQAASRLANYGITVAASDISEGELLVASEALDGMAPFIGERHDENQEWAFPRSVNITPDTEGQVPERVLDAVALIAYTEVQDDSPAPIKSESILDHSVTYAAPTLSQSRRRVGTLVRPYQRRAGSLDGTANREEHGR